MQRTWHAPNKLPIILLGQVFRNITWHYPSRPQNERAPYPSHEDALNPENCQEFPVSTFGYGKSAHRYENNWILGSQIGFGGVMVNVLASMMVDCGCGPRSGETKDYTIGICCFSAKHAALRKKSKDWLAPNQNNVS